MSGRTANRRSDYDVLIVGCGPTGAALANLLRRFGHSVAILDRDEEVFPAPRATRLDDESVRILQSLGILSRLEEERHVYQCDVSFRDHSGRELMTFDRVSLGDDLLTGENGHYTMVAFHQPSLERILREDFDRPEGADAYLGYEVLCVEDRGPHAEVVAKHLESGGERVFTGRYVIGCDGGQSLVRRAIGGDRIDLDYTEDYLVLDTIVEDEVFLRTRIPDGAMIHLDPKHAGVLFKGPHGNVRFDFLQDAGVVGEGLDTEEGLEEAGRRLILARGLDPEKFRIIRYAPYRFYAGMPSQWRKGRLLVAGDAAHQTPPWSGQGLNMCMRDCANLSFKLDLVLSGRASDLVLDTYREERQPPSIDTIKGAVDMGKVMQAQDVVRVALRNLVFFLARRSRFVRRLGWKAWQRKPRFAKGLIGNGHGLSGTVMPQPWVADPEGNPHRLDDMIGLRFALVTAHSVTGPVVERFSRELGGVVLNMGPDYLDPSGEMIGWFTRQGVSAVLVRPDRCIFDAGDDANALCESLFLALQAPEPNPDRG